jgi:hypothetical protein
MRKRWTCFALPVIVTALLLTVLIGCAAHPHADRSQQSKITPPELTGPAYPDSAAGLEAQFAEILRVARSNDQVGVHALLDSLAVPNAEKWLATHFDPRFASQLPQDYTNALARYQSHITWVIGNFAKFDDFAVAVQPLPPPAPPAGSAFESLLPRPNDEVNYEDYRLSSIAPNPTHGPPSWVSSFVYIEGRFRYVGGTYPFWLEGLAALRGPMSMPPTVIHGRSVQAIAFGKDQPGPGIDAIVQLKVKVGRDGHVRDIEVVSGDAAFVEDAEDYVKDAEFGALPDTPQLANARREWDIEVAFFTPKNVSTN